MLERTNALERLRRYGYQLTEFRVAHPQQDQRRSVYIYSLVSFPDFHDISPVSFLLRCGWCGGGCAVGSHLGSGGRPCYCCAAGLVEEEEEKVRIYMA